MVSYSISGIGMSIFIFRIISFINLDSSYFMTNFDAIHVLHKHVNGTVLRILQTKTDFIMLMVDLMKIAFNASMSNIVFIKILRAEPVIT